MKKENKKKKDIFNPQAKVLANVENNNRLFRKR